MGKDVDIGRLGELFECRDGKLFWRINSGRAVAGNRAGYLDKSTGYRRIAIDGKVTGEHRVVFAMAHGRWPKLEVDHINGAKDDNRPENLREATRQENMRNCGSWRNSKSGVKGVYWVERLKKWKASITPSGSKPVYIGLFETLEEASMARSHAESTLNFGRANAH